jgi:hypothetical protein
MAQQFNSIEKRLADFLKKFPFVKRLAKRAYQYLNYFLYVNKGKEHLHNSLRKFTYLDSETFFGYYDKSPIDIEDNFVLFHSASQDSSKKPPKSGSIDIVVYDLEKESLHNTYKTKAWNWQQGARLQWLTNDLYAFNDFDENSNKFITRVNSIQKDSELRRFEYPIQDAFKDQYFLSLNYTRLNTLRPDYGYRNLPNLDDQELKMLGNDGIWYVDYESGEGKLLLSLEEIVNFDYKDNFKDGYHYVNHVMISTDGERFIFLHRFFKKGRRFDRLLISDRYVNEIKVLADNEMVSHCYWIDNNNIIGYLNNDKKEAGFYLINVNTGEFINYADGRLDAQGDGHPNVSGKWFVCDSYPDKSRMQHLTLNNLETGKSINLGEFFHGFKYNGETRCDLHPRFSHDGKKVFFDSVFDGNRNMYMLNLVK